MGGVHLVNVLEIFDARSLQAIIRVNLNSIFDLQPSPYLYHIDVLSEGCIYISCVANDCF